MCVCINRPWDLTRPLCTHCESHTIDSQWHCKSARIERVLYTKLVVRGCGIAYPSVSDVIGPPQRGQQDVLSLPWHLGPEKTRPMLPFGRVSPINWACFGDSWRGNFTFRQVASFWASFEWRVRIFGRLVAITVDNASLSASHTV